MKLVGTKTSPYVRKIRVILAEKNLAHEFVEESAWTADTKVPTFNPLNKVPALVMDDGEAIYDSTVISEYLDSISGGGLVPSEPAQRARARRNEALGNGLADAGITARLEGQRDKAKQDEAWIKRQMSKVHAAIDAMSRHLGSQQYLGGAKPNIGDIGCACALFWLEFRMPEIRWRETHPNLKGWAERMESRPSFRATPIVA
ncbi:MAG TPA: glutathione S-transferase C-terminal domain-containing protein [Usitatibacter sp.]|nr:glutathione S-transferase C-terminal domain-containing protein [Usitatibacter sp.]